jgi:hypothetical protein
MHHSAVAVNAACLRRSAGGVSLGGWLDERDTRLTWEYITWVAAAARMWHLIRLHRVPVLLRLVHDLRGCSCQEQGWLRGRLR